MKSIIITGKKGTGKTNLAQSILDTHVPAYTNRLHHNMNRLRFGQFKELPFLKCVLFEDVPSEERIFELDKLMSIYAPRTAAIYTIQKHDLSMLPKEDRFNVVNLMP